jgi:hypothetical protein
MSKARLNFVIPDDLDHRLTAYCEAVNRTPTDVVRQLVLEWLEGDSSLPGPALVHPSGRRTNILLSHASREALETKISNEGHATTSAAVSMLLARFLAGRGPDSGAETVTVRVPLPVRLYNKFVQFCESQGTTAEAEFEEHAKRCVEAPRKCYARNR